MVDRGEIAARIDRAADRQHGHVTRAQLLEFGLPERTISYRIKAGRQLVRLPNDARLAGHLRPGELPDLLIRCPRLARLLDPDQRPTKSNFEDAFLRFLTWHRLPPSQVNAFVSGYEVDRLSAAEKVIIELDGWEFHQGNAAFERDRERGAAHSADNQLTIRVTSGVCSESRGARRLVCAASSSRRPG